MPHGSLDTDPPTGTLPMITITDATPQKTSASLSTPTLTPCTPSGSGRAQGQADPYRVLYRGALSLPDSYLQLDGLAFSARLPSRHTPGGATLQDSPLLARELMYNPLALALESMHGRQALRFKGTVRLQDVWMDDSGDVYMDIHPYATLTRVYFENVLCLAPLVVHEAGRRTEVGVRVALGDTDGPETTDVVIYGETSTLLCPPPLQLSSAATSTSAGPPPLSVRVARLTPAPRAPRPDDPTPRQPPAHLFGPSLGDLGAHKRILARPATGKGKEKEKEEDHVLRRARQVMLHLPCAKVPANGGSKDKNKNKSSQRGAVFKVPELPAKTRRKPGDPGTDVFGAVEPPQPRSANGKVKGKTVAADRQEGEIGTAIEAANKLVLKKLTVHRLADAGIPRTHAEFKDMYGFVYRGAAFALRSQLKMLRISARAAEAVVEAHVKMYVPGDAHDTPMPETPLSDAMALDAGV